MNKTHAVAVVGECMIEMAPDGRSLYHMQFAGDTLNAAVYMARLSQKKIQVNYITALGDDDFSDKMLKSWLTEGIHTDNVRRIPRKLPGLYLIRNDEKGERYFYYYRSQSPAREMFEGREGDHLCEALLIFPVIYLSGITLAILLNSSRHKLLETLKKASENKNTVVFDTNYREILWSDKHVARSMMQDVLMRSRIALLSFDDERSLFGDETPEDTVRRVQAWGPSEIVVKLGEKGYLVVVGSDSQMIASEKVKSIIDATGAGDAFNGTYVAMRLQGYSPEDSVKAGAKMTAVKLGCRGGIIPKASMPDLF